MKFLSIVLIISYLIVYTNAQCQLDNKGLIPSCKTLNENDCPSNYKCGLFVIPNGWDLFGYNKYTCKCVLYDGGLIG